MDATDITDLLAQAGDGTWYVRDPRRQDMNPDEKREAALRLFAAADEAERRNHQPVRALHITPEQITGSTP